MIVQRINKWVAAGALAVATIPAVGFARPHRPVQAAPSLMATNSATPAALASTTGVKHKKVKHHALHSKTTAHAKLSAARKGHKNLHARKRTASKLHQTKAAHKNLHAKSRKAAA